MISDVQYACSNMSAPSPHFSSIPVIVGISHVQSSDPTDLNSCGSDPAVQILPLYLDILNTYTIVKLCPPTGMTLLLPVTPFFLPHYLPCFAITLLSSPASFLASLYIGLFTFPEEAESAGPCLAHFFCNPRHESFHEPGQLCSYSLSGWVMSLQLTHHV